MEVRRIFDGLYQELRGKFVASVQIKHSGGKGAHRESALRHILAKHLPRRYSCGTGTLVSTSGRSSYQCDIVIHDDFYEPPLLQSEEHAIFAADAVFGVVEVKSNLSSEELKAAHKNIQAAKETANRKAFFGGIVGFTAGRTLDAVAKQVADLNSELGSNKSRLIPDSIAVLDQGLIEPFGVDGKVRVLRSEHNTLLHFFVGTLHALNQIELKPVDFSKYLSLPVRIGELTVQGHDCFVGSHNDGQSCLLRLRATIVRRIYETCQAAGEQQLIDNDELERIRTDGTWLGALVVGTGFVYNPTGRKIVSASEVRQWENGRAIVGPDELYPQDYIRINRDIYYLDMEALNDSDFEENTDLTVGELTWEYFR